MLRRAGLGLCLCVGVALTAPATLGDDAAAALADARRPTLEELLERIEQLEKDKAQMAQEIDVLRAEVGNDWLTEQRADEIKALVADVLADADTRASLLQDGMTAGWDGNFFLASADNRFKLTIAGLMQVRWIWNYHNQSPASADPGKIRSGWENTRTQLTFAGHVFGPDLTYLIRSDFSRADLSRTTLTGGQNTLLDAWIRYHLSEQWSLRVGQFRLPFNREELVLPQYQQVIERSLVNESLNIGRTQGIEVTWADRSNRVSFVTSDGGEDNFGGFGLVGNPPINTPWNAPTASYSFTGRYENLTAGRWEQFRQFTSPPGDNFGLLWGVAAHYQQGEYTGAPGPRDEESWFAACADVSAEFGGSNLFASLIYQYIDDPEFDIFNVLGATIQGGMYFTEKLEGYARLEWGWVSSNFDFPDLWVLTLGGNYYFDGQDIKLSADIGFGFNQVSSPWDSNVAGWRLDSPDAAPQIVFRTQLQLMF
jgi:hypothetical protein